MFLLVLLCSICFIAQEMSTPAHQIVDIGSGFRNMMFRLVFNAENLWLHAAIMADGINLTRKRTSFFSPLFALVTVTMMVAIVAVTMVATVTVPVSSTSACWTGRLVLAVASGRL